MPNAAQHIAFLMKGFRINWGSIIYFAH
jgi:hypothetical protein